MIAGGGAVRPPWRAAALLASACVVAASQIALVSLAPGLTHETAAAFAAVAPLILLLIVPTALSFWIAAEAARGSPSPPAYAALIALGLLIRVIWFGAPAPIEDDFFRYLWDGAVVAHGFNPYAVSPAEALGGALGVGGGGAHLGGLTLEGVETLARINFPELRSIYPGTAQAAFAGAHVLAPWSLDGLRVLFLTADLSAAALLVALLRERGANPAWAALYWCSPFVAFNTVGLAHVDALLPPLILGALLLIQRRPLASCGLIGLAAGVKLWPVLLAPLFLRPLLAVRRRLLPAMLVLCVALAATLGPLFISALDAGSGLTAYAGGWANNNALFAWALDALRVVTTDEAAQAGLRASLALVGAIAALAVAWRPAANVEDFAARALVVCVAAFFCSPAQFPWYALWFLPLAILTRFWPLIVAAALIPAYYLFFPFWSGPSFSLFSHGVALIHAAPIILWAAWRLTPRSRPYPRSV
ncbi:MAG: glycosyltransferase 87 family protein [Hyphomicrobiales bacterium]|nr:glycosyltransferase 87 family protein [Hyphomicrobiales bacterium]